MDIFGAFLYSCLIFVFRKIGKFERNRRNKRNRIRNKRNKREIKESKLTTFDILKNKDILL